VPTPAVSSKLAAILCMIVNNTEPRILKRCEIAILLIQDVDQKNSRLGLRSVVLEDELGASILVSPAEFPWSPARHMRLLGIVL
jgi:D-alanine-D-alanine ligase-like ATP-grasp enzyme